MFTVTKCRFKRVTVVNNMLYSEDHTSVLENCEHVLHNTLLRVGSLTCEFMTTDGPHGQATESGLIIKATLTVAKQFEVAFTEKPPYRKGEEIRRN